MLLVHGSYKQIAENNPLGEYVMKESPRGVRLATSIAVALLSLSSVAESKEDKPLLTGASTDMIVNTCVACHGPNGASKGPSIPSLSGMSETYVIEMMEGYASGEIPSTIMGRIAQGYNEQEIEQMGQYFASQEYVMAAQQSDAAKAAEGAKLHDKFCEKCHSESGAVADDDSGFLKGQWKPYLAAQLMDYRSKDRVATKKMMKKLTALDVKHGDAGIEALIEYYGSK
jgi:sulfide dehydrogenase cytochrome subunit